MQHVAGPFKKKFREYEQPWHIRKFDAVREEILELEPEILNDKPSNERSKYLAHTAAVLEQASEDLLGFEAAQANKSIMTKLPAKLFCDFSRNGSLAIILCCALRYKNEQGWKADDFKERLLKDTTQAVSLFLKIEKDLLHAQLLKRPKVFFSPMLPKEVVSELKIVVQRHNGTVVLRADQATHEIIADVSQEEEDGDYCRTIDEQDNKALVHWWYYPDSYREWKPQSEIEGKPEPAMPTPVLWKVQARFIRDLEKFNEWMNEEDYLATDDDDDDDDGAERVDGEGVQEAGSKRRRAEDDDGGETRGRGRGRGRGKGRGRGRGRGRRSFEVGGDRSELESRRAAEEQLYDTPKPLPAFRAAPESLGKGLQTGLPRAMVSLEAFAAQARALTTLAGKGVVAAKERAPEASPPGVILVPSYASWYKMNEIAPQERKAMAEWFTGTCTSKTPQSYVEARDLIVKLYRENPTRHLTATECRRHLAIDVCAVLRLHAFLQHWGLINYNLSTAQRPVVRGPMDSTGLPVLIAMPNGTLVPKDVLSAGGFGVPDGTSTSATSAVSKNFVPASHAATQANIFHTGATDEAEAQVPSEQIRCTVTGQVCTAERYHCIQKPELVISPAAFASEQWPPGYSAIDFVRVCAGSVEPHAVVSDWTDTEVLRLLEALEQYGEDWTRVAAYVSSKTKEQCILQFLRLPIEDRYLDEQERAVGAGKESNDDTLRESSYVMAQVAFLCQSISPDLANKATQAAMTVLLKAEAEGTETEPGHAATGELEPAAAAAAAAATAAGGGSDAAQSRQNDFKQKAANVTALAAAAIKARSIALTEEKEIQRLIHQVLKRQLTKLQSKLANFEKLEVLLQQERESLRRQRAALGTSSAVSKSAASADK